MKIKLYSLPNSEDSQKIRNFLIKNSLPFEETVLNDLARAELTKLSPYMQNINCSILKINFSHGIQVINGFNEFALNQLLEHFKKYKPKIRK